MKKFFDFFFARSFWVMMTIFFTIFMCVVLIGSSVAEEYKTAINNALNLSGYDQVKIENGESIDTEYFKSKYYKTDGSLDHIKMRNNSKEVAHQVATEGSVLLWNNNNALPLPKNTVVNLFGYGSLTYKMTGEGSGRVNAPFDGDWASCLKAVDLTLNSGLNSLYLSNVGEKVSGEIPWSVLSPSVTNVVNGGSAVYVISRSYGEGYDASVSINLKEEEKEILTNLNALKEAGKVDNVIVVLNIANQMRMSEIMKETYGVDACLWVGHGGVASYKQVASALSGRGKYVVSGKLPDTWYYTNYGTPANENFGDFQWTEYSDKLPNPYNGSNNSEKRNLKYVVYQEGIYVGYRYSETRYEDSVLGSGNAASSKGAYSGNTVWNYTDEIAFPFGHGLTYTQFSYDNYQVQKNTQGDYDVSLTIKNVGDTYASKDVLQVYLQKPYTDYDRENKIEKSSVELVGYAKTKLLAPNEQQTLTVTVKAEDFKTYDAYNKKTYILEKGDYYLAFGTNAHDAVNNILSAKGKTTADGMTANGNTNFVEKITFVNDDFETYSKSTATGYPITNRAEDVDINLYQGTQDQTITYLSRNDWAATYPKKVSLKCIDQTMVTDMSYCQPVVANPEDKMPIYGTVTSSLGQLSLIQLKDLPYEHELWEDLLNQLTLEEQQLLMSVGLGSFAGAMSVNAPGCQAKDGPVGISVANAELGSSMAFPCEPTMCATFNDELIETMGEAFGMEILHIGYSVIYGPGAGIHRSTMGGRNWEYYSEDGFISGKMLSAEVKGLQKYGIIVDTKHFVLNEQETNRHGIATFCNEQTLREVYLKPFEIGVIEGKMNGIMTSFNRVGTTWIGAHYGLLTEVLRNEWGFTGLTETDAVSGGISEIVHMTTDHTKAAALLAGQNVWMSGQGRNDYISAYTDNATVMLALREACHRNLYAQLHSRAMNGIDSSTRIVEARNWWQDALTTASLISVYLAVCCVMITLISFVYHLKEKEVNKGEK